MNDGRYGFRHDPMAWVENDGSLQAALVRKLVFDRASEGDEQTIESHFRETFAKQSPDGSLEDEHDLGVLAATGGGLVRLLEMGCSPERPEMARAFDAVQKAAATLDEDKKHDVSCASA